MLLSISVTITVTFSITIILAIFSIAIVITILPTVQIQAIDSNTEIRQFVISANSLIKVNSALWV